MKKLIVKFFAISMLLMLASATSIMAQTPEQKKKEEDNLMKVWNDFLLRVKKQKDLSNPSTVKQLTTEDAEIKKIRQQLSSETTAKIERRRKETGIWNEYTPKNTSADMDLMPLLAESPSPVYTLPQAGTTNVDARYDPYFAKVKRQATAIAEESMKGNKLNELYKKEGEEGVKKKAMAEADQSVMIQQMGGTENLMKMSEAERKAAGLRAAENIKQNPSLLTGSNDPGMNMMMQKLMNDKEYANRFKKMSQAEKEAEMKKFMTPQQPDPNFDLAAHKQNSDKLMSEANKVKYTQEITLLGLRANKRIEAAAKQYSDNVMDILKWKENVTRMLGNWYAAQYKAIPIVELGEYGHDKDPELLQALDFSHLVLTYQLVSVPEMQLQAGAWDLFKSNCKYAVGEANEFAGRYKWGKKASDDHIFAPDADQQAANVILQIYGIMEEIAKQSKDITTNAKSYQLSYEERLGRN